MYLRNSVVGQRMKRVQDIFTSNLMLVFKIPVQFELPLGHISCRYSQCLSTLGYNAQ